MYDSSCAPQIQTRDMAGFADTRYQLLQNRANNRTNWLGFAVAHHLSSNYDLAVQVLEAYESTVEEVPDAEAYEHSELLLYKAMVLQEGGRAQDALQLLVASQVAASWLPPLRACCCACLCAPVVRVHISALAASPPSTPSCSSEAVALRTTVSLLCTTYTHADSKQL